MAKENRFIYERLSQWIANPESFCRNDFWSNGMIRGVKYEYDDGSRNPIGGFQNGRLANAVRLMQEFPAVDLYTPSMVDFYEGNTEMYSESATMSVLYERISQATFGRMLPFICFNPQRAVDDRRKPADQTPIGLVKKSIMDRNFIGVKLHPSVGFGPIGNESNACPNAARQQASAIKNYRATYGKRLDDVLWELFEYCADNDVPILTHGGPGIPAYGGCMKPADHPPGDWLNAPTQWVRVMDELKRRNPEKPLRLCYGHFAGAFSQSEFWKPWFEILHEAMSQHSTLYADISIQTGLVQGEPRKQAGLREAFTKLFESSAVLRNQALYGTDWHMPEMASLGGEYLTVMQTLIPMSMRNQVMGANAVEYLGLKNGRGNRTRIDTYATWLKSKARIPDGYTPGWMRKVDAM